VLLYWTRRAAAPAFATRCAPMPFRMMGSIQSTRMRRWATRPMNGATTSLPACWRHWISPYPPADQQSDKLDGLRRAGIEVVGRRALPGTVTAENRNYLSTKVLRAGHLLNGISARAVDRSTDEPSDGAPARGRFLQKQRLFVID